MTETEAYKILSDLSDQEELEIKQSKARSSHLEFMKHTWMKSKIDPFIIGFHTERICNEIDQAIENYRKGISTYLLISVHHRAGKSDIVSRYLPPHLLGEFPDSEVMQVTYNSSLSTKFSSFGRNVFRSEKYKELYPHVKLSKESNAKDYWEVYDDSIKQTVNGKLFACGLTSGLTGSGWNFGILDDYCAGRKDAESKVMRDNAWEAFTNDFMTRAAPVHICIILATQWHWDDVNGRIRNEMKINPLFPEFKMVSFPAKAKDYKGEGSYSGKFLFEERYGKEWYEKQYATLGKYSSAALLDCDPQMRNGSILSTDGIVFIDKNDLSIPSNTATKWIRVWDLAHTEKQRSGDDPDYTSGTFMAITTSPGDPVKHIWIKNVCRIRAGATKRDNFMRLYATKDDKYSNQVIESSIDSKDAYDYAKNNMPDINWRSIVISGDKIVRCSPLEPSFETKGHVHVVKDETWNDDWLDEVMKFDGSDSGHDDQIDNISAGWAYLDSGAGVQMSEETRAALMARRAR